MALSYTYHARAIGFDGKITEPEQVDISNHGLREWVDKTDPGSDPKNGNYDPFSGCSILKHGGGTTSVVAHPEDGGFFRTEITSDLLNLNVEDGAFTVGKIHLGMVTMYKRGWYDSGQPWARRARVLPVGCTIENAKIMGVPVDISQVLPAPFFYSAAQCEDYFRTDQPDAKIENDIRATIAASNATYIRVKNFGRIYFGAWNVILGSNFQSVHRISMVRLALGSPGGGDGTGGGGEGNGTGIP